MSIFLLSCTGLEVFYCLNQDLVISESFSLGSSVIGCAGASGQPQ